MHILVTNDDGPPSQQSSPYVHSLVKALQDAGHVVSVILPHMQRSWIGKAHFVGQVVKPTYFRPGTLHQHDGTTHDHPLSDDGAGEEWVLVEGTPATCTQLGLYHFFQDRGPVDLVVSGPNYGRNSTALFSLSSGTIGGAMEAATHRRKAVALSYAFYSRDHDPVIIAGASRLSVKIIEHLYANWGEDVDLYSINVPLIEDVEKNKVMYTHVLQNYWSSGSSFQETDAETNDTKPEIEEEIIRHQKDNSHEDTEGAVSSTRKQVSFKWAPKFTDIHKSVAESAAGNDGWALGEGYTSVTPLKANFMHANGGLKGELKLSSTLAERPKFQQPHIYAHIAYEDPYVQPLILSALETHFPTSSYTLTDSPPQPTSPLLLILPYESLPFSQIQSHPTTTLCNAYIIRKALIRKHYLASTIHTYVTKNPDCVLRTHVPLTVAFELDYAAFLDEALVEAWELHESFEKSEREWWILKPSMADRGQGVRLFSSEEELRGVFEEWEEGNPEGDEEDEGAEDEGAEDEGERTGVMTSQLRHFIAQRYIPPLLFPELGSRKFHIRTYVLAYGALKVYVYREMLALFAAEAYVEPGTGVDGSGADMRGHLTNTCLQDGTREGSVLRFWDLPPTLPSTAKEPFTDGKDWRIAAFESICDCTSALFLAAAAQPTNFQPLPNAFEVFGVDWMVDADGKVWLLEVNAFPDFRQSGTEGREVIEGLWKGVMSVIAGFCRDVKDLGKKETEGMVRVLDLDMGRG